MYLSYKLASLTVIVLIYNIHVYTYPMKAIYHIRTCVNKIHERTCD